MKQSQKLYNSRIRSPMKKPIHIQNDSVNSSLVSLEDPDYINSELSKFEKRIPEAHGFCWTTKEHSMNVANT